VASIEGDAISGASLAERFSVRNAGSVAVVEGAAIIAANT